MASGLCVDTATVLVVDCHPHFRGLPLGLCQVLVCQVQKKSRVALYLPNTRCIHIYVHYVQLKGGPLKICYSL